MIETLDTPLAKDLLFCLLTLWPAVVILRRLGLPVVYAGLVFGSALLPYLGHALFAVVVAGKAWPKLPTPPVPKRRTA